MLLLILVVEYGRTITLVVRNGFFVSLHTALTEPYLLNDACLRSVSEECVALTTVGQSESVNPPDATFLRVAETKS